MSRNKAKTRVRSARGRKNSSTRWLQRQLNDPYINKAKKETGKTMERLTKKEKIFLLFIRSNSTPPRSDGTHIS